MKHVLFYIYRYPGFGGIEKLTTLYGNYFVTNLNWKVSVISYLQENEDQLKSEINPNIELLKIPDPKNLNSEQNENFVNTILEKEKIDVIIFQDCYANIHIPLFSANKRLKIPIITVEHNSPLAALTRIRATNKNLSFFRLEKEALIKALYPYFWMKLFISERSRRKIKYGNSTHYVLLSDKFFKEFQKISGISKTRKLVSINNPITIEINANEELKKKKQLLYVGRIEKIKNVKLLVKIWEEILLDYPDWEFIIVGDGGQRKEIESYVVEKKIERVHFKGFFANVKPFYQDASIFLMASLFEGWGLTITEAMTMGVVPVAFNTYASLRDIVESGKTGFLVEPWNVDNYVSTLKKLMDNRGFISQISKNALAGAEKFSFENTAPKWVKLIENISE